MVGRVERGDQNNRQVPPAFVLSNGRGELEPVHPWHLDVGDDGIHRGLVEDLQGVGAIGGNHNRVTRCFEDGALERARHDRVIDHQHTVFRLFSLGDQRFSRRETGRPVQVARGRFEDIGRVENHHDVTRAQYGRAADVPNAGERRAQRLHDQLRFVDKPIGQDRDGAVALGQHEERPPDVWRMRHPGA